MSIILIVTALLLVAFLPGREAGDYNQKAALSLHRLEKVENAMKAFMAVNGRRPCPADGQYAVGDAKFGIEADTPGICTDNAGPNHIVAPLSNATDNVVGGVIPTKTLNIPDEDAFDGWGRRFTYVVDVRATEPGSCYDLQQGTRYQGKGAVTIRDGNGKVRDYTMYAYISHGADGHGAFPAEGSLVAGRINSGSSDADTLNNASVNSDFTVNFDNVFVQKERTTTPTVFDDIVYYDKNLKNACCIGSVCIGVTGLRIDDVTNGDLAGSGLYSIAVSSSFIAVGVPNASPGGKTAAGSVFIIPYNTWGGFPVLFNDSSIVRLDGEAAGDKFGTAVRIGKVATDLPGVQQLIVGAPGHSVNAHDACGSGVTTYGAVYIIFNPGNDLKTGANATTPLLLSNKAVRIDGPATTFGTVLAVGDINGDGTQDVGIGVPNAYGPQLEPNGGTAFALFGTTTTVWLGRRNTYGETDGWVIAADMNLYIGGSDSESPDGFMVRYGPQGGGGNPGPGGIGSALAIGDVDGDGKGDLIIGTTGGAPYYSDYVYVVFGPGLGQPTYLGADNTPQHNPYPYFIYNIPSNTPIVSLAAGHIHGAVNGSFPIDDIVIGVGGAGGGNGTTYVVYGATNVLGRGGTATSFDITTLNGTNGYALSGGTGASGTSVATADVNGDGLDDVIIGAPATNGNKGGVYVVLGGSVNLGALAGGNGSSGFYLAGTPSVTSQFGAAVAGGDVNGDTLAEVFVGASAIPNSSGHGSIFGVYGNTTWPGTTALGSVKCHFCP